MAGTNKSEDNHSESFFAGAAGENPASPPTSGDAESTTGTGDSEEAVGRVAGQDEGYLETGAEKRAEEHPEEEGGRPAS